MQRFDFRSSIFGDSAKFQIVEGKNMYPPNAKPDWAIAGFRLSSPAHLLQYYLAKHPC